MGNLRQAREAMIRADNRLKGAQAMLERLIVANRPSQEVEEQKLRVRVAREMVIQHQAIVGKLEAERRDGEQALLPVKGRREHDMRGEVSASSLHGRHGSQS